MPADFIPARVCILFCALFLTLPASLGKIVDMLFAKGISFTTGKSKWTRAAVDKLLANKKYIPIVGVKGYMDTQFEKNRRCNVDYDKAGHPRKSTRYQSSSIEME